MRSVPFVLMPLLLFITSATAQDTSPASEEIRTAIQNSIPHIEREGWKWIKTKKCLSCHMIPFMQWSLHEAKRRGITLDSDRLGELDEYVQKQAPKVDPAKKPKSGDTESQILISRAEYAPASNDELAPWITQIVRSRTDGGFWAAGGQLPSQKRPKAETQEVSTLWVLASLKLTADPVDDSAAIEKAARAWLANGLASQDAAPKSAEWYTARLVLEVNAGDDDAIMTARNDLLKLQRDDGGWGWLTGSDSDSLATAPALWALTRSGLDLDDVPVQRAVRFLLDTQRDDGTWRVESTRARDKGAVKPTSVFWGTTWAVIGLSQLLPVSDATIATTETEQ